MPAPASCPHCGCPLPQLAPSRVCPNLDCRRELTPRPPTLARRVGPVRPEAAVPSRPASRFTPLALTGAAVALIAVAGSTIVAARLLTPADPVAVTAPGPEVAAPPVSVSPPPPAKPEPAGSPPVVAPTPEAATASLSGEQVYRRLLRSAALVVTDDGLGTGVLVDAGRRLVVTNDHVVDGAGRVSVLFPLFAPNGEPVTEPDRYLKRAKEVGTPGVVVARRRTKDLALVRLDRIPDGVRPVPISGGYAPTGSKVYSVGGSGASRQNLLWRLSAGMVRGRSERVVADGGGTRNAMVLETDAPVNPGDSGGPVVNDRGQLVAVVAHYLVAQRAVSGNIDVSEVRALLAEYAPDAKWVWADPAAEADDDLDLPALLSRLAGPAPREADIRRIARLGPAAQPAVPTLVRLSGTADGSLLQAVVGALDAVGPPRPADLPALVPALRSRSPEVRRYAARAMAAGSPPVSALEPLAALLDDPQAEVRIDALRGIGRCPATARPPGLLAKVLEMTGDPVPEVSAAAAESLASPGWKPGSGPADRAALLVALRSERARTRAAAVGLLAPAWESMAAAVDALQPVLNDPDPAVRRAAALSLARWPNPPAVTAGLAVGLSRDPEAAVRQEAYRWLAKYDRSASLARLADAAKADPDPVAQTVAIRAVSGLRLTEPGDLTVIESLLGRDDEADRRLVGHIPSHGPAGAKLSGRLAVLLGEAAPETAVEILRVVGQIGRPAADVAPKVYSIAAGNVPRLKQEQTRTLAVETLVKLGDGAMVQLARLTEVIDLPDSAAVAACRGLETVDVKDPRPVADAMVRAANRWPECRPAAADVLVKHSGDATASLLRSRLRWTPDRDNDSYPADMRLWAIQTIGRLNLKDLSKAERDRLLRVIATSRGYDPETANRRAAERVEDYLLQRK